MHDSDSIAYILIQVTTGKAFEVLKAIRNVEGVKDAHTVTGEYDIIALVEAKDLDELGKLVVSKIQKIEGIIRTVTAIVVS